MTKKDTRTAIKQRRRITAVLQKEIGSRCPFCRNEDVGHFDIHHLDNDRTNHSIDNLLLLCKSCHSKFTLNEWPLTDARNKKGELLNDISYLNFQSSTSKTFDYTCYSMQKANGRIPEPIGNGSFMNIEVIDRYHFKLILRQSDKRIWKGELVLERKDYGNIFFRYVTNKNEYEFGRRECYLKQVVTSEYREDSLYFKPLTDLKDYGDELVRRRVAFPILP